MPNGGVPGEMALFPADGSGLVLHSGFGTLTVYPAGEWNWKRRGRPVASLTRSEAAALAWHLRYWLGEHLMRPPWEIPGVKAEMEY